MTTYTYGYEPHPIRAGVTIGHDGRERPAFLVVIRCTPIRHTLARKRAISTDD
jgi:hypothetical protein